MILVGINGGLGNQMFQYALGRKLAIKNRTKLVLDISIFNEKMSQTKRTLMLNKYRINAKYLDTTLSVFGKIKKYLSYKLTNIYREPHYHYDPKALQARDNTRLIGYWQSYKYFDDIRNILIQEFKPIANPSYEQELIQFLKNDNTVSIHVRRGDYIFNKEAKEILGALPLKYYENAIKYLENIVKNPRYIVFSDDIAWCKRNLGKLLPKTTIYYHQDEISDLDIMTKTRHNIIANSSYSWWGAYLGEKKLVIAPKTWFKTTSMSSQDLIPPEWIQL